MGGLLAADALRRAREVHEKVESARRSPAEAQPLAAAFMVNWARQWGLGFGVQGLGAWGVWGLGFGVWGLGFGVWGLGFGVWGLGFGGLGIRVGLCLGIGIWGLGFSTHQFAVERNKQSAACCIRISFKIVTSIAHEYRYQVHTIAQPNIF